MLDYEFIIFAGGEHKAARAAAQVLGLQGSVRRDGPRREAGADFIILRFFFPSLRFFFLDRM